MDKNLLDFLNGDTNVLCLPGSTISRERAPTGSDFITVRVGNGDSEMDLFGFWNNPRKSVRRKPPKHTGGKKPYIMVMVEEIDRLKEKGIPNVEELVGYLVCLGKYVEWNTGRLINKRTKNQLRYKDLQGIFGCSHVKLNRLLADMREHELLSLTEGGYFISARLIKKGQMV